MGPDEISIIMIRPSHSVDLFVSLIKALYTEELFHNYTCCLNQMM
jgi:hypothetical protein